MVFTTLFLLVEGKRGFNFYRYRINWRSLNQGKIKKENSDSSGQKQASLNYCINY